MASVMENIKPTIPLKLLVDDKKTRVLAAEATSDFVDILLSFLTLPLGTIVRVTNSQLGSIGCMNNLYQSIQQLSTDIFSTEASKSILLNPRNPHADVCKNLKLNIDDSSNGKYYLCPKCSKRSHYPNARCCRGIANIEKFKEFRYADGFIKSGTMFVITDDLRVLPASPSSLLQLLQDLGFVDISRIDFISIDVGLEEVSMLLKRSLLSKCPLTNILFGRGPVNHVMMPEPINSISFHFQNLKFPSLITKLSIKILFSKSTNKILGLEVGEDFLDFLFSFCTIPLGSVIKLLDGKSELGCIDNLYKSVESLDSNYFDIPKDEVINGGVAKQYKCNIQPLRIRESNMDDFLLDPRNPSGNGDLFGKYVKTNQLFIVLDNFKLSASSISFFKELSIPLGDIEERVETISEPEAVNLLKASLTSSSALTNGLNSLLKMPTTNFSKSYVARVDLDGKKMKKLKI